MERLPALFWGSSMQASDFDLTTKSGVFQAMVQVAARCSKDPLRFVRCAFPWGKGMLEGMSGPDVWQEELLSEIGQRLNAGESAADVIRMAVASGHGIGKSTTVSWLILWAICTYPDTRGVVTANTDTQLRTKTWAELAKWYNLCLFKDWFQFTATSIFSKQPGHDKTWRIDAIPWSESNPEAFAGLHNQGKRILVVFDEASSIADIIWEVVEGAVTDRDTQIIWTAFGNPTRSVGRFFDCFGRHRHRWWHKHIDSRTVGISNKALLKQWEEDYGEDSDFFKVRVRGIFPSTSSMQFIPRDIVQASMERPMGVINYAQTVAIIGVDVARFGDDASVIWTRFALDGRSIAKQKYHGLDGHDLGAKVAEHYNHLRKMGVRKIVINVDTGGVGASPVDWLRHNGYPVNAVNFGAGAVNTQRYKNLRAEMWGRMKEWIAQGGCLPQDADLETDLTGVEYGYTPTNQILLEKKEDMKKRGMASPDNADALALTFAVRMNEYIDNPTPPAGRRRQEIRSRDPYR